MKVKPEDFKVINEWIRQVVRVYNISQINENDYKNEGLSPMRFRWDVLHFTSRYCASQTGGQLLLGDGIGMKGLTTVYGYANDDHIDTALRTIFKELGFNWASIK